MGVRFLSVLVCVFCCSCGGAEDSSGLQSKNSGTSSLENKIISIPLSSIWAWDMPGTQNIRELEKDSKRENLLAKEIRRSLPAGSWESIAGPAFIVEGSGLEALKNAHAVFTGEQQRAASLPNGRYVSVVFFTLPSNNYVHITHVDRYQNTILIRYEFVPKSEENLPRHIALIPLGQLPKGQFEVDIVAEPFSERFRGKFKEIPDERKLPRVSSSFDFKIK